jgi:hypothetical protein
MPNTPKVATHALQVRHHPKYIVNIIFGGAGKRVQKLTLCKILSVEPATSRLLRYSEVPIFFSKDDQWTSFFELRKFPLVLDPIVAGSQVTRVLNDGGSGLNLLFTNTLKKMGLNISKMLLPSRAPFYGIVPGNTATPLGSVVLPVTLGRKATTAPSTSSSRWRILTRHIMPSLADRH